MRPRRPRVRHRGLTTATASVTESPAQRASHTLWVKIPAHELPACPPTSRAGRRDRASSQATRGVPRNAYRRRSRTGSHSPSSLSAPTRSCDRACLKSTLDAYLSAIIKHDPAAAPLADSYRHTENAINIPLGKGVWQSVTGLGKVQRRYIDPVSGQAAYYGIVEENGKLAIVTARLRVEDRAITEGRVVYRSRRRPRPARREAAECLESRQPDSDSSPGACAAAGQTPAPRNDARDRQQLLRWDHLARWHRRARAPGLQSIRERHTRHRPARRCRR